MSDESDDSNECAEMFVCVCCAVRRCICAGGMVLKPSPEAIAAYVRSLPEEEAMNVVRAAMQANPKVGAKVMADASPHQP